MTVYNLYKTIIERLKIKRTGQDIFLNASYVTWYYFNPSIIYYLSVLEICYDHYQTYYKDNKLGTIAHKSSIRLYFFDDSIYR